MAEDEKDEAQKGKSVEDAAEAADILGTAAAATGLASEQGETVVTQEAEGDILSGPMASLENPDEAHIEAGKVFRFEKDEATGAGKASAMAAVPVNPSSTFPGRDALLAATDGGRLMPGNLDAILRARFAGTPMPGDAQLLSKSEIDALAEEFSNLEPIAHTGEGIRFVEGDDDPNSFKHEKEINPNIPTDEIARKAAGANAAKR